MSAMGQLLPSEQVPMWSGNGLKAEKSATPLSSGAVC
jgi:hypothetical protein